MQKTTLREISKFASGLVAADFMCGLWFYFGGVTAPTSFFGIALTQQNIILWMLFDVILFGFLVHYAWKMEDRSRTDNERLFHNIAGVVFTLVALLHLSRIVFGWQFILGSWDVPYWLNGLGTIITAFLAYLSFHLGHKK
jgi:hypothetical protein